MGTTAACGQAQSALTSYYHWQITTTLIDFRINCSPIATTTTLINFTKKCPPFAALTPIFISLGSALSLWIPPYCTAWHTRLRGPSCWPADISNAKVRFPHPSMPQFSGFSPISPPIGHKWGALALAIGYWWPLSPQLGPILSFFLFPCFCLLCSAGPATKPTTLSFYQLPCYCAPCPALVAHKHPPLTFVFGGP